MDRDRTNRCDGAILLNAEAFGFGPAVAVASVFPHLHERFERIGFVGTGHTLDVQRSLPYDEIHDLSGANGPALDREMERLAEDYDIFFTAMDFAMLERAKAAGMTTCGYDALTWYWREIPAAVGSSDLYLAQDFFGVRERLSRERESFPDSRVVPPIVSEPLPRGERCHTLLNLGGLQNPFWSLDDAIGYARKIVEAVKACQPADQPLIIATSTAVATAIGEEARTYSREEMKGILSRSRLAIMTPGLGNIYDAAVNDIPTVWLPPANDSQGQQLTLIERHGMSDGSLDWGALGASIEYWDEQRDVLGRITDAARSLSPEALRRSVADRLSSIATSERSKTCRLIEAFGTGGDAKISEHLHELGIDASRRRT